MNNHRVVFGLLYDKRERAFPFRWKHGRMTVLSGPGGRIRQADVPDRNAINERGQIAGDAARRRPAARGALDAQGQGDLLPPLPGHSWTNAWSINQRGVVSGWSRKLPNDDGENNPVIWTRSGKVVALKTAPGRADGAAEATNRSGLTVGYLGNLGTDTDPETTRPRCGGPEGAAAAAGPRRPRRPTRSSSTSTTADRPPGCRAASPSSLFPVVKPAIWQTGWTALRTLPVPASGSSPPGRHRPSSTTSTPVERSSATSTASTANDYGKLQRIYPVLWTCAFGR